MKNKKFTITSAQINARTDVVIDCVMSIINSGIVSNSGVVSKLYPTDVQIINGSAADVEWNTLNNPEEIADYAVNPNNYAFIKLPKTASLTQLENKKAKIHKFIIKGRETSANADLDIIFINYI